MATKRSTPKGVPAKDGTGRGTRSNRGRGGCLTTRRTGRGGGPRGRSGRR